MRIQKMQTLCKNLETGEVFKPNRLFIDTDGSILEVVYLDKDKKPQFLSIGSFLVLTCEWTEEAIGD